MIVRALVAAAVSCTPADVVGPAFDASAGACLGKVLHRGDERGWTTLAVRCGTTVPP